MIIGFVPNVGKFAIVVGAGKSKSSSIYRPRLLSEIRIRSEIRSGSDPKIRLSGGTEYGSG